LVFECGLIQGCAELFPVGQKLVERVGLNDGTREDVIPHLRPLLEHYDSNLFSTLLSELFDFDGGTETSGSTTNDNDIDLI